MSTAGIFEKVISDLRGDGYTVREVRGWRTRGRGTLTIKGQVWHHTAGSPNGNTPSLALVIDGSSRGLPNALSNFYIARNGTIYVVAARTAWHAGAGGTQGMTYNSQVFGVECENTGRGEPWGSYGSQVALAAAVQRHAGNQFNRIVDHKEWTSRKIDRTGISPSQFRQDVRNFKGRTTGEQAKGDMVQYGDKGEAVAAAQVVMNEVLEDLREYEQHSGGATVELSYKLKVDGIFGNQTKRTVYHLKRKGILRRGTGRILEAEVLILMSRKAANAKQIAHSFKPHGVDS